MNLFYSHTECKTHGENKGLFDSIHFMMRQKEEGTTKVAAYFFRSP